ncbi:hypothetical protein FS749_003011 [Ceratobasidium sp. UAMH 11750]|nr:hypothetical protein FS749_003011 [Ceratobasidium sp. UAMH 11750]
MPKRAAGSRGNGDTGNIVPAAGTSTSFPLPALEFDATRMSGVGFAHCIATLKQGVETSQDVVAWRQHTQHTPAIPRSIVLDAIDPGNLSPLVVSQLGRLASRVIFGPFPYPIGNGLARLCSESLEPKRWSLYLGAHIVRNLLEGTHQYQHIGWIDRFQRQLTNAPVSTALEVPDLEGRLSSLQDLAYYALMIIDSRASYSIFKQCLPLFLQLAAKYPNLWAENSAISIFHALHCPIHDIRKFVFWDTVSATAFGTAPLLHYNTTFHDPPNDGAYVRTLGWAYGCPGDIIVLLAKINSWRVSKWVEQADRKHDEWHDIAERLRGWKPVMDMDQSSNVVARFAIQESWRQVVLIYTYMGMCDVDSSDARVESSVRQIVQLANVIGSGNPLEIHMCMPCIIAGVAARQEPHRALIRKKIALSRNENVWSLRGADFVPVLDHLWHGAGAGGRAVTWEDYVTSRCMILPIDA